ncbi:hypothetical protein KFK09_025527 [Dendrobium nobile]|uniref:Uncharacterized protein n=1 Tax=Dendrobium nobile TaxID=94219 RepID=A0A8T3AGF0_DENNO|nr:hypothetical protein KFK09_025527 [Dendrobium nobile]
MVHRISLRGQIIGSAQLKRSSDFLSNWVIKRLRQLMAYTGTYGISRDDDASNIGFRWANILIIVALIHSEAHYRVQRDFCHIQVQLLLLLSRSAPTSLLVFLVFTDKENLKSSVLAPMPWHVLLITSETQPLCPLILHLLLCQPLEIFPTPSSYWLLPSGLILLPDAGPLSTRRVVVVL